MANWAFVDVDGTLIEREGQKPRPPKPDVVKYVKKLIMSGWVVAVWSAEGVKHARKTCERLGIRAAFYLKKPCLFVDDHKGVRDKRGNPAVWLNPEEVS